MTRRRPIAPAVLLVAGVGLGCLLVIVFGDVLAGRDHRAMNLDLRLAAPLTQGHLLGTDELGRDVLARLLTGLRWSVATAVSATAIAFVIGTTFGLIAARRPSLMGEAMRLLTTFTQAFPPFVLAVTVIAVMGDAGFWSIVLTLGLVTWPVFSRVVYAEACSLFQRDYVLAAEMTGMSAIRLFARHVLPGLIPSLSVLVVFHFADMIVAESALSFLGIGAPLGAATWGAMLSESRGYMLAAPWLTLAPALAMVTLIVCAHVFGQHLRNVSR